jgi:hypothetical protein
MVVSHLNISALREAVCCLLYGYPRYTSPDRTCDTERLERRRVATAWPARVIPLGSAGIGAVCQWALPSRPSGGTLQQDTDKYGLALHKPRGGVMECLHGTKNGGGFQCLYYRSVLDSSVVGELGPCFVGPMLKGTKLKIISLIVWIIFACVSFCLGTL